MKPRHHQTRRPPAALPSIYRQPAAELTMRKLTPHAHLDNLRDGVADRETWNTLKYRINEGASLASRHHTDNVELRAAMAAAVEALCSIGKRYLDLGKFGCSGDEFRAIGRALDLTDELQNVTTTRQHLQASILMHRAPRAPGVAR